MEVQEEQGDKGEEEMDNGKQEDEQDQYEDIMVDHCHIKIGD